MIEQNNFSLLVIKSFFFKLTIFIFALFGLLQLSIYLTLISNLLKNLLIRKEKNKNDCDIGKSSSVYFCDATTITNSDDISEQSSASSLEEAKDESLDDSITKIAATAFAATQDACTSDTDSLLSCQEKKSRKRKKDCCGRCCAFLSYT